MGTLKKLKRRQQERIALLNRAIALAQNDPRVCAAWLFGSGYRDDADAFSDIDLWMVVDDAHAKDVVANRHTYVTQLGQPLLTLDVAGNAPVDGGYLMLQYPGKYGPLQLDWYWQPRANAVIPDDARVIFDRSGMERWFGAQSTNFSYTTQRVPPPASAQISTTVQQLHHELTFFWCMVLIAAKDIARRDALGAGWMLQFTRQKLAKAHNLLSSKSLPALAIEAIEPTSMTLDGAKVHLRHLHRAAEALLPYLTDLGGHFSSQLAPTLEAFFDLTQAASALEQVDGLVRIESE